MSTPHTVIVTISRQMGCGGAVVGQAVARRLGVRYLDREILEEAARVLGRDDRELEGFEERVASLWTRMAGVLSWGAVEAPYVPPPAPTTLEDDLFAVETRIIQEVAAREDAVVVGRGGSWILREHPGLLSVCLHAPEAWRVARVRTHHNLADAEARELVRRSDQQRGRFLQALRGLSWLDASGYHLAVDTSAVDLEAVVDLVVGLASRRRGGRDATPGDGWGDGR